MSPQTWGWIGFNVFVLLMLALDLGVFHRKAHVVKWKEAVLWSVIWVALALATTVVASLMIPPKDRPEPAVG